MYYQDMYYQDMIDKKKILAFLLVTLWNMTVLFYPVQSIITH